MESDTVATTDYRTGFARWRASENGFREWLCNGAALNESGALQLDPTMAHLEHDPYPDGGYHEKTFYNAGSFIVGEVISKPMPTNFAFCEAIISWNAFTPPGTWVEPHLRAQIGARWTKWYSLGVWAVDYSTIARHSVGDQRDSDATVSVDTLVLGNGLSAQVLQIKLRLFSVDGRTIPCIDRIGVAFSTAPTMPVRLPAGEPRYWDRCLEIPAYSQMIYPDGGNVWCSPTCLSMVLSYWQGTQGQCEPQVRAAVEGVFDWLYEGHGNWPFNTAYAAAQGFESYVVRLESMAQAETWIACDIPLILSLSWKENQLSGAPLPTSSGHLIVLAGFDAMGNPVVNDPAAPDNQTVRRVYVREQLERFWIGHSGGTAYAVYPPKQLSPLDHS